jgi:ATP-dependent Lon protease
MLSAFIEKPVRNDTAMTGEISLRGRIMPIGGLREKVLAAHRAGITQVLYPSQNEYDIDEIPDEVKGAVELIPVSDLSDALSLLIIDGEDDEEPAGKISTKAGGPLVNLGADGPTDRNHSTLSLRRRS